MFLHLLKDLVKATVMGCPVQHNKLWMPLLYHLGQRKGGFALNFAPAFLCSYMWQKELQILLSTRFWANPSSRSSLCTQQGKKQIVWRRVLAPSWPLYPFFHFLPSLSGNRWAEKVKPLPPEKWSCILNSAVDGRLRIRRLGFQYSFRL